MPPTPVRSKPGLTFPPCLTCGQPVEYALTFEARAMVPRQLAPKYHAAAPDPDDPNRTILWVGEDEPAGMAVVGGAPDRDQVMAMPCACVQHGELAHAFLIAALNLTHPDVEITVTMTMPAALLGQQTPVTTSVRSRLEVCDVMSQRAIGLDPIRLALNAAAAQLAQTVPGE